MDVSDVVSGGDGLMIGTKSMRLGYCCLRKGIVSMKCQLYTAFARRHGNRNKKFCTLSSSSFWVTFFPKLPMGDDCTISRKAPSTEA